ncbi:hypothetical protein CC79DRAFT_1402082 [Sarocladium strictum]
MSLVDRRRRRERTPEDESSDQPLTQRPRTELEDSLSSSDLVRQRRLTREHYTIAWICALHLELAAAIAMLDEEHAALPMDDDNHYVLGNIGKHNIVIACPPEGHYGNGRATSVLDQLRDTFSSVKRCLVVGIGAGFPRPPLADIRLRDVVVGQEVTCYDEGKIQGSGRFERTGESMRPSQDMATVLSVLRARHEDPVAVSQIFDTVKARLGKKPAYQRQIIMDNLYTAEYVHPEAEIDCAKCDNTKIVSRPARDDAHPAVHYGTIASGNTLIKNGIFRDKLARDLEVIGAETEAAGLMGILIQRNAAANAAAYARAFLELLKPHFAPERKPSEPSEKAWRYNGSGEAEQRRAHYMSALQFSQMNARKFVIKERLKSTCEWLLQHETYISWRDDAKIPLHKGFFWLRGKPGSGKSTLMKFAYDVHKKESVRRKLKTSQVLVASYFFHSQGEVLQRSIEGMYRSLVFQLFNGFVDLQDLLDDTELLPDGKSGCPSLYQLQVLLERGIARLKDRQFICYVDALDECAMNEVPRIAQNFQNLAEEQNHEWCRFRAFLSSRHYPHIQARIGLQLVLEQMPGHAEDLTRYVNARLAFRDPDLTQKLTRRANGLFLWVLLVVDDLNRLYLRGHPRSAAQYEQLGRLPADLSIVFANILHRYTGQMDEFIVAVVWMLFSRRPLSPAELEHAIWSGIGHGTSDHPPPSLKIPFDEESSRLHRRITSSSKGLAEVTTYNESSTAQFIHESVRDFLLKDGGLVQIWPESMADATMASHQRIGDCCESYLLSPAVQADVIASTQSYTRRSMILDRFPLLQYAVQNHWYHRDLSAVSKIESDQSLELPSDFIRAVQIVFPAEMIRFRSFHMARTIGADSGYVSRLITEPDAGQRASKATSELAPLPTETNMAISVAGTLETKRDDMIAEFRRWFHDIVTTELSGLTVRDPHQGVLALICEFGIRLCHEGQTRKHRDIMYIACSSIKEGDTWEQFLTSTSHIEEASEIDLVSDSDDNVEDLENNRVEPPFPWQDRIQELLLSDQHDRGAGQEDAEEGHEREPTETSQSSDLDDYQEILKSSTALAWLRSHILQQSFLSGAEPSSSNNIRQTIRKTLRTPSLPNAQSSAQPIKVSRKLNPQVYTATFHLDWNPIQFTQQELSQTNPGATFAQVITISGTDNILQALSCEEYVAQVWPQSGPSLLQLLQDLIDDPSQVHQARRSTFEVQCCIKSNELWIEATGIEFEIAEIGEQLSWLITALQYKATPDFSAYIPDVSTSWNGNQYCFSMTATEKPLSSISPDSMSHNCWRHLFRYMPIAYGFPVPSRPEGMPGLEINLNLAAQVIGARRVVPFKSRLLIKGFTSILYPTKFNKESGTVSWHVVNRKNQLRISYADSEIGTGAADTVKQLRLDDLQSCRHIIGWCETLKHCAGASESGFDVMKSNLRPPDRKWLLKTGSISAGKVLNVGINFTRGGRLGPLKGVEFEEDDIPGRIESLASRYYVLHDVEPNSRRAWLIDGPSTLLHLTRGSLKRDRNWVLKDKYKDISDFSSAADLVSGRDAAARFLSDVENLDLVLREVGSSSDGKEKKYRLGDRIKEILLRLELMSDQQDDMDEEEGLGFYVGQSEKWRVIGYDFADVVAREPKIRPHELRLEESGLGWVEFARGIGAVSLFGQGFGELLQPQDSDKGSCEICYWNKPAPKAYDFLAVSMSDLQDIHRHHGTSQGETEWCGTFLGPRNIRENLLWQQPLSSFALCGSGGILCTTTSGPSRIQEFRKPERFKGFRRRQPEVVPHGSEISQCGGILLGCPPTTTITARPKALETAQSTDTQVDVDDIQTSGPPSTSTELLQLRPSIEPQQSTETSAGSSRVPGSDTTSPEASQSDLPEGKRRRTQLKRNFQAFMSGNS